MIPIAHTHGEKTGKWNSKTAGIQRYSASAWTSLPFITSLDDVAETGLEDEAMVMLSSIKVSAILCFVRMMAQELILP